MGHIKLGLVNFFAFSNYAIDIGIKLVQIYQKMELHHFRYHQACQLPRNIEKLKKKIKPDQARPDFLVPGVPSGLGPPQR